MKSKEHLAMDYIFFRNPSYYIIMLFPIISGFIGIFFVADPLVSVSTSPIKASESLQYSMLDIYLDATAIVLSLVISYFVIFKWVLMKTDGTYGFWITQGVSRKRYFIYSLTKMVSIVTLSYFIGLLFFTFLIGIKFSPLDLIMMMLLLFSNILVVFSLAILFSELITDPELAATLFLGYSGFNLYFNDNYDSLFHKILLSDRHYADDYQFGIFLLAITLAGGLLFLGFELHQRRSIDL